MLFPSLAAVIFDPGEFGFQAPDLAKTRDRVPAVHAIGQLCAVMRLLTGQLPAQFIGPIHTPLRSVTTEMSQR